jgi:hypothetical protein
MADSLDESLFTSELDGFDTPLELVRVSSFFLDDLS